MLYREKDGTYIASGWAPDSPSRVMTKKEAHAYIRAVVPADWVHPDGKTTRRTLLRKKVGWVLT